MVKSSACCDLLNLETLDVLYMFRDSLSSLGSSCFSTPVVMVRIWWDDPRPWPLQPRPRKPPREDEDLLGQALAQWSGEPHTMQRLSFLRCAAMIGSIASVLTLIGVGEGVVVWEEEDVLGMDDKEDEPEGLPFCLVKGDWAEGCMAWSSRYRQLKWLAHFFQSA